MSGRGFRPEELKTIVASFIVKCQGKFSDVSWTAIPLFLAEKNPGVSKRVSEMIGYYFSLLESEPEIGSPLGNLPELRELIIPFGESGYVALYRYEKVKEMLYILAS